MIGHADELAQIAVMTDQVAMLQGGAAVTRDTVTYAAADYANALLVLADAAAKARAELRPDARVAAIAQPTG